MACMKGLEGLNCQCPGVKTGTKPPQQWPSHVNQSQQAGRIAHKAFGCMTGRLVTNTSSHPAQVLVVYLRGLRLQSQPGAKPAWGVRHANELSVPCAVSHLMICIHWLVIMSHWALSAVMACHLKQHRERTQWDRTVRWHPKRGTAAPVFARTPNSV